MHRLAVAARENEAGSLPQPYLMDQGIVAELLKCHPTRTLDPGLAERNASHAVGYDGIDVALSEAWCASYEHFC